jgi:hypothetical protein
MAKMRYFTGTGMILQFEVNKMDQEVVFFLIIIFLNLNFFFTVFGTQRVNGISWVQCPPGSIVSNREFGEMAIGEMGNIIWRNGKYYLAKWENTIFQHTQSTGEFLSNSV